MKRPTDVDRRTYIKGVTVAALAGGVPVAVNATQGQQEPRESPGDDGQDDRDRGSGTPEEIPVAQPFVGDLDGETLSGNTEFDVENRYDGDPAEDGATTEDEEDGRDFVLHYTTDEVETQDYPAALFNFRERPDREITLGDLEEDGYLEFDFYVGPKHDQYIPGQVYLVIRTPGQAEDEAWGLYRNVHKGGSGGEWRTLDVVEEMSTREPDADGRDPVWRALEIDVDPEGFRADFETFSDAILERAVQTRDEEGATFDDVFAQYDGDSTLLAAGLGSGISRSPTVRDVYYDYFRVGLPGDDDDDDEGVREWSFDLPAVLQMNADFGGQGRIEAALTFDEQPEAVDPSDVDEDSVRLYPFSQIMPPMGEGAEPNRVDVSGDRLEARFPPGRVRDLEGIGGGDQLVAVAGRFDTDHVLWFFGVGETTVPGN